MVPGQTPKVIPPGQQKKVVPAQPKVAPRGPMAPPKSVVPTKISKMGFRSRPQNNLNEDDEDNEKPLLCPDCARAEEEEAAQAEAEAEVEVEADAEEEQNNRYETKTMNYRQRQVNQNKKNNSRGKYENKYSSRTYQKKGGSECNLDHYKYHEIDDITDERKRGGFIVKKGGVVISSNLEL